MAVTQDIVIYKGEDILLDFTMTPVQDISGWTILLTLRQTPAQTVITTRPATIISGPAGTFSITLPSATTITLPARSYVYDVVRTDSGAIKVLSIGSLVIKPGIRTV